MRSVGLLAVAAIAALLAVVAGGARGAFPGPNGEIAFVTAAGAYVVDPDGANLRQILRAPIGGRVAYSPNGAKVVFAWQALVVANADGTGEHSLEAEGMPGYLAAAAWSPDMRHIVFSGGAPDGRSVDYDLYVFDLDANRVRRLTSGSDDDYGAAWSPDGGTIVFGRAMGDGAQHEEQLFQIAPDGTNLRSLTPSNLYEWHSGPAWSPDGRWVAFREDVYQSARIGVVRADGSDKRLLTGGFYDSNPAWAPDGSALAFQRYRAPGKIDIEVVPASGGSPRILYAATVEGYACCPDWRPLVYDLTLTHVLPAKARVGRKVFYSVTVRNVGGAASPAAELRDVPPLRAKVLSVTGGTCAREAARLRCEVPSLAPGARVRFSVAIQAPRRGRLLHRASVVAREREIDESNNAAQGEFSVTR